MPITQKFGEGGEGARLLYRYAIDPLATKYHDLLQNLYRPTIADSGVDPSKSLLLQVTRRVAGPTLLGSWS